jgi:hypothetical protein
VRKTTTLACLDEPTRQDKNFVNGLDKKNTYENKEIQLKKLRNKW